jgi:hypothetical protein
MHSKILHLLASLRLICPEYTWFQPSNRYAGWFFEARKAELFPKQKSRHQKPWKRAPKAGFLMRCPAILKTTCFSSGNAAMPAQGYCGVQPATTPARLEAGG